MTARWVRETGRHGRAAAPEPPPRLEVPLGQGDVFAGWLARARTLDLPHALVVEGGPGTGKTTASRYLTAALLCPSELDQHGPCGACRTCARIAADLHPDVHVLERAQDEQDRKANQDVGKSFYVISVDQVRAAQAALARHAVEGRARVLRIDDADCMAEPAQNALLKTLEEPGADTFLLLEAATPERLLPTVRSRVQRLRVLPLDEQAVGREILRRLPERAELAGRATALARGSLGRGLSACTERTVQLHDLVLAMLAGNKGLRPVATASALLEGVEERRQEIDRAREFLWLLRAELRARRDALAAAGGASYPSGIAEPWASWLELTLAAERDLDLSIPPVQVLAACLLQFDAR
ncbi:MAG: AAA family ATPase [Planctomycetes bacterium]|nr:AAA family ATPase [Planctomycetota bacterium]